MAVVSSTVTVAAVVVARAVERGPVEQVLTLVVVIEGVVIVLPNVLLGVNVVSIEVSVHADVREAILKLGVIVIGNGGEGVEQIGVNLLCLWHIVPLLLLLLTCALLHVRLNAEQIGTKESGVKKKVGAPAHAAEGAQGVGSETHLS